MEPSYVWHGERDEGEHDAGSRGGCSDGMEVTPAHLPPSSSDTYPATRRVSWVWRESRSKMSPGISAAAANDDGEEGEEEAGVAGRRGRGWQGSSGRCIGSGTCCGRTTSYASRGSRATSPTSSLAGSSTPVCSTSPSRSSSSTASRACRRWASSGSLENLNNGCKIYRWITLNTGFNKPLAYSC